MWIRIISMAVFVVFLTFSCQKETSAWDREEDLKIDSTTFLFSANYVANIDTQVTVQIEIVTLNGLNSETNYYNKPYYDSVRGDGNHTLDVSNVSEIDYLKTSYSSILLIDQNNSWWYSNDKVGYYMRRYFELLSSSTSSKVGLASFNDNPSQSTQFYSETPINYFGNSWEFNTETFYKISEYDAAQSQVNTEIYLMDVINRIDETIDHFILLDEKQGDLSITFFASGSYIDVQSNQLEIDNLILKAISNQIRINLIGFKYDFNTSIRRLALETGGFIGSNQVSYHSASPIYDESKKVSNTAVILENLDLILSREVTSHRCNLIIDKKAGESNFISGTTESIPINHNGKLYTIQFSIP